VRRQQASLTQDVAYRILRNGGVASVFGIAQPPSEAWPYQEESNADKLVEEAWQQLTPSGGVVPVAPGEPYPTMPLTRESFSNIQRAAVSGAVAIRTILDVDEDATNDDLERLITKCCTWGSALMGFEAPLVAEPSVETPALGVIG
jgi:hypothetical protein